MPYAADRLSPSTRMDLPAAAAPAAESMHNKNPSVLKASGIGKAVKSGASELVILRDIDLEVTPGEAVAVVGASGSGQSTLPAVLSRLDTPSRGTGELHSPGIFSLGEER